MYTDNYSEGLTSYLKKLTEESNNIKNLLLTLFSPQTITLYLSFDSKTPHKKNPYMQF